MEGKKALGVLLAIVGGIVVLNFIGVHLGSILGFLFPFILIGLGVVGWKNNKKWLGGILVVIGALMLLGKLSYIIMWAVVIGIIVYVVSLLKKSNNRSY